MASTNRVFVSPGVYTSEKDLSFVTRQVGVTTLGLVGETVKGPAFQPIFVSNYDEFKSFFGGLNASKIKDTGVPAYELPYIAKSYLTQSNQLFVSRILGFSGYDAGQAWGITLDASVDTSTAVSAATGTFFSGQFTGTTGGTITSVDASDPVFEQALRENLESISSLLMPLTANTTAETSGIIWVKNGSSFDGVEFEVESYASDIVIDSAGIVTGSFIGSGDTHTASSFAGIDNQLVALLRSRAKYDGTEDLNFFLPNSGDLVMGTPSNSINSPLGDFTLSATTPQTTYSYNVSLDRTKKNYLPRVFGTTAQGGDTVVYVEELFADMFTDLNTAGKIRGIKQVLINYGTEFKEYRTEYKNAVTPWVVSELRGTNLLKLFRFHTISDGNNANSEFKMSIINIRPDDREFDVVIRNYNDTDAKPSILEKFSKCSMDPASNGYIGKRIGTLNGDFPSKSNYILVELEEESNTSDAFPAGFVGYPTRDYSLNGNTSVVSPSLEYKTSYGPFENKRKIYLGLSNTVGIDQDFFDYKGVPTDPNLNEWTGTTKGFHMDNGATGATIDNYPPIEFEVGSDEFRTENGLDGTSYEKVYARKFTFAPYGGFDGWDVYRTNRTNGDKYVINGSRGILGEGKGVFTNRALTNGDTGLSSDYYAYLEGIWTFNNPEAVNINVFATPGIDTTNHTNLIEETIEMIEQERADSLYITTSLDTDSSGDILLAEDAVDWLDGVGLDSNYTATYWPWVQINDVENNQYIYVPPTRDVVRNIALTDNVAFPWFAVAGVQRGDVNAVKARVKLTQAMRDTLYDGRINPIATFTSEGIKIWGNRTLQIKESALDRINVRRLLLQARKLISSVSIRLLFEQNDDIVRNQFLSLVNPILDNIRSERGLTDFRVVLDDDPEARDRKELCGRIFIKPTNALEFICVEFNIMNTGASFDDI